MSTSAISRVSVGEVHSGGIRATFKVFCNLVGFDLAIDYDGSEARIQPANIGCHIHPFAGEVQVYRKHDGSFVYSGKTNYVAKVLLAFTENEEEIVATLDKIRADYLASRPKVDEKYHVAYRIVQSLRDTLRNKKERVSSISVPEQPTHLTFDGHSFIPFDGAMYHRHMSNMCKVYHNGIIEINATTTEKARELTAIVEANKDALIEQANKSFLCIEFRREHEAVAELEERYRKAKEGYDASRVQ